MREKPISRLRQLWLDFCCWFMLFLIALVFVLGATGQLDDPDKQKCSCGGMDVVDLATGYVIGSMNR